MIKNAACPAPITALTSGGCYSVTPTAGTWFDAVNYCQQQGAHLATIDTQAVNDAATAFLTSAGYSSASIWIGLNDIAAALTFTWINGSAVSFTDWLSGEPNNNQNIENCVAMNTAQSGQWYDVNCASQFHALCQWNQGEIESIPECNIFYSIL